jgi:hypothetical protein
MAGFITVLTGLACLCALTTATIPSICSSYDCPSYTQEAIFENNFERTYTAETKWASTTQNGGSSGMFMKLFRYIGGDNSANQKIAMTVPVPRKITTLADNTTVNTMSFYLTSSNPPTPTEADVTISTQPANTKFYVREFETWGWGAIFTDSQWAKNLKAFKKALSENGKAFVPNVLYKVGYSPPWHFTKTCELWLEPQ